MLLSLSLIDFSFPNPLKGSVISQTVKCGLMEGLHLQTTAEAAAPIRFAISLCLPIAEDSEEDYYRET